MLEEGPGIGSGLRYSLMLGKCWGNVLVILRFRIRVGVRAILGSRVRIFRVYLCMEWHQGQPFAWSGRNGA